MKKVVEATFEDPIRSHIQWKEMFINANVFYQSVQALRDKYNVPEGLDKFGAVEDVEVVESPEEFLKLYEDRLRQKALQKLTEAERQLLGLE